MKRCITVIILFLTVIAHTQPQIYYTAVKCTGQESVVTIDSLFGFSLPVQFAIDGLSYQSSNTFKGYSPGQHTISILDSEHNQSSFSIEIMEMESPLFEYETEYRDCSNYGLIKITSIEGNGPFTIYQEENLIPSEKITVSTQSNNISVQDTYGCITTETIHVLSSCFRPYNAITPNGDGFNDYWEIPELEGFPDAHITVFNKWGQEIYEANSPFIAWDGNNLPMATYYYVIQLDGKNDDKNVITGDITIVR